MGKWPSASSLRSVDFHGFSSSLPLTWPLSRNSRARRFGEGAPVMDQRIDPADCEVIEQGLHPSGADIGSVVEAVDREEPHRRTFRRIGWHRRVDEPLPRASEYDSNKLIAILTTTGCFDNLTGREFSERFGGKSVDVSENLAFCKSELPISHEQREKSGATAFAYGAISSALVRVRRISSSAKHRSSKCVGPNWQRDRLWLMLYAMNWE